MDSALLRLLGRAHCPLRRLELIQCGPLDQRVLDSCLHSATNTLEVVDLSGTSGFVCWSVFLPNLKVLKLDRTPIRVHDITGVYGDCGRASAVGTIEGTSIPQLQVLSLAGCFNAERTSLSLLNVVAEECPFLYHINLSHTRLDEDGARTLAYILAGKHSSSRYQWPVLEVDGCRGVSRELRRCILEQCSAGGLIPEAFPNKEALVSLPNDPMSDGRSSTIKNSNTTITTTTNSTIADGSGGSNISSYTDFADRLVQDGLSALETLPKTKKRKRSKSASKPTSYTSLTKRSHDNGISKTSKSVASDPCSDDSEWENNEEDEEEEEEDEEDEEEEDEDEDEYDDDGDTSEDAQNEWCEDEDDESFEDDTIISSDGSIVKRGSGKSKTMPRKSKTPRNKKETAVDMNCRRTSIQRQKGQWEVGDSLKKKSSQKPRRALEKDPNAPKRPCSSYFLFMQQEREALKIANPDATNAEFSKLLGGRWRAMSNDEKAPYIALAAKAKADYTLAMSSYKLQKEESHGNFNHVHGDVIEDKSVDTYSSSTKKTRKPLKSETTLSKKTKKASLIVAQSQMYPKKSSNGVRVSSDDCAVCHGTLRGLCLACRPAQNVARNKTKSTIKELPRNEANASSSSSSPNVNFGKGRVITGKDVNAFLRVELGSDWWESEKDKPAKKAWARRELGRRAQGINDGGGEAFPWLSKCRSSAISSSSSLSSAALPPPPSSMGSNTSRTPCLVCNDLMKGMCLACKPAKKKISNTKIQLPKAAEAGVLPVADCPVCHGEMRGMCTVCKVPASSVMQLAAAPTLTAPEPPGSSWSCYPVASESHPVFFPHLQPQTDDSKTTIKEEESDDTWD